MNKKTLTTLTVILLGFALRILASERGHNYDFDSYIIVLNILEKGGNVYAETTRYNYGPIWFWILRIAYGISNHDQATFRTVLVIFLSCVDLGIFFILLEKYGKLSGYLFFLNPISIIITGYHNQFDNLAILMTLFATILIDEDFDQPLKIRKYAGLVILGISLVTKHLFFFYPIWLSIKQKGTINKIIISLIPYSIFLLSFTPYLNSGLEGIVNNVFIYKSYSNAVFYSFFTPVLFQLLFSSMAAWILILAFFGFYFRESSSSDSFFFYTCILVAASPAITNQYLAIPISYLAVNLNLFSFLYIFLGLAHLLLDIDGLHLLGISHGTGILRQWFYFLLVILLWTHFINKVWEAKIKSIGRKIYNEIKKQFS